MKKIVAILIIFLSLGCQNTNENLVKYEHSFLAFDTYISFSGYSSSEDEFNKQAKIVEDKYNYYHKLYDKFNNYDNLNNVKTINDNASIKEVVVEDELYQLIKQSLDYYNQGLTGNNILLGAITSLYQEQFELYNDNKTVTLPSDKKLDSLRSCTNISDIVLKDSNKSIYLKNKCNQLDLGSVAKGYATNIIINNVDKNIVKSAILNAGGNVSLYGKKPDNTLYNVGIANPNNQNNVQFVVNVSDINVVTSGDYQRYFMVNNIKYHHLIDPNTLKPSTLNKSVSIITKDGFEADYLSTAMFMLDIKQIEANAKKYNFDYIVVDKDNKTYISEGIKDETQVK